VVSHQLMIRAGMIKKLGAGIYNYMPMGLRVIRKVEAIVREEMDRAGAIELTMPVVQPAELWQETGRFAKMGPELLRIRDRHDRDFVIQPTSEEVVTDIARQELRSYKQLPKNFYQIQTKFRDERRPRFGLMRGREFIMKDAYSFDRDPEGAQRSYQNMALAYRKIFDRFGLRYRAVAADSGAIGGDLSEEFQVIASTGEDAIVYCPNSNYAANLEKAEALAPTQPRAAASQPCTPVPTPGRSTCEQVAELLGVSLTTTVKSLVLATDQVDEHGQVKATQVWLLLLRGDHDMNEVKVGKLPGFEGGYRFATVAEIDEHFGCKPGYLGPLNLRQPVRIVADREVAVMADWICGANQPDMHIRGVNWGRDLPEPALVAFAQRGGRRSVTRRSRRVGHRAWHRGGACVLPGHQVLASHERHLPGRNGQAATDADGLLRHWRDPLTCRRHRAEPRRTRHHLAGRHCTLHRGGLPDWDGSPTDGARSRRAIARPTRRSGRGRDARRPWRTPGRDVCRLGTHWRAAPRGHLRSRAQGGATRIPAPP